MSRVYKRLSARFTLLRPLEDVGRGSLHLYRIKSLRPPLSLTKKTAKFKRGASFF